MSVSDVRALIGKLGLLAFVRLLAERIRADFVRWPEFQKSPRAAAYFDLGVIELMPASDGRNYAFKYVNGHPSNYRLGLPTVMGFGCFADAETGWPLLLAEMTLLTAIRTAATSAVAAQALANKDASAMALIGNGAQAEFQVVAFNELLGIRRFHLYDVDPSATERLMANLSDFSDLEMTPFGSTAEAVRGCEIVTTATADRAHVAILTPEMIAPGMHINAIGGDCPGKTELPPDVLKQAHVFVEFAGQTWIEGEIQQMLPNFPVTELWEVLAGLRPGRESSADVTVFDSVGFSIEDFSTLALVHELAREHGLGTEIELIPPLANAKDLFSALKAG